MTNTIELPYTPAFPDQEDHPDFEHVFSLENASGSRAVCWTSTPRVAGFSRVYYVKVSYRCGEEACDVFFTREAAEDFANAEVIHQCSGLCGLEPAGAVEGPEMPEDF